MCSMLVFWDGREGAEGLVTDCLQSVRLSVCVVQAPLRYDRHALIALST